MPIFKGGEALYSQTEVSAKITALKAYSAAQDPLTADLFTPLETAVTAYFNASGNLAAPLRDVVKYMYNDIARRTTVYETDWPDNLPTDYPAGYNDVRGCIYDFTELMTVDNATFFAAFVYETPTAPADGGAAEPVPVSNDYLTDWEADITAATTADINEVAALAEWCKNSEGNCDLIDLLEDRGKVLSQKSREEIAADIYIDRGVLEIIQVRGVDVYVPTYLAEGGDTDV